MYHFFLIITIDYSLFQYLFELPSLLHAYLFFIILGNLNSLNRVKTLFDGIMYTSEKGWQDSASYTHCLQ